MNNINPLIVVDMQTGFSYASAKILQNAEKTVPKYNEVIFLEYKHCGNTIYSLLKLARNKSCKTKIFNDGSYKIAHLLSKKHVVHLIGVNTCFCVDETAKGLAKRGFKVRVLFSGCFCCNKGINKNNVYQNA